MHRGGWKPRPSIALISGTLALFLTACGGTSSSSAGDIAGQVKAGQAGVVKATCTDAGKDANGDKVWKCAQTYGADPASKASGLAGKVVEQCWQNGQGDASGLTQVSCDLARGS